jgi:hypothetical protein
MSERMVDVFVNEELIKSYRISLRVPYVAPDSQFVAEAKKHLAEEEVPADLIHRATFLVRFI